MNKLCLALCVIFMVLVIFDMVNADTTAGDIATQVKDTFESAFDKVAKGTKDAYDKVKDTAKEQYEKITS